MGVDLQHTRNIGIMAHIDAGKTTLTERILYYTGTRTRARTHGAEVQEAAHEIDCDMLLSLSTLALKAPHPISTFDGFEPWSPSEGFRFEILHQSKKPGSRVN